MGAALSVIIPAHDEAGVLGGFLRNIVDDDTSGLIELVVVANGCHDDTAATARVAAPRAIVVEITTASKIAALNAGDRRATVYPRVYVDADVRISGETLLRLAQRLAQSGASIASPRLEVDASGASVWVRSFYRIWEHTSFRTRSHIGSGVYALTERAHDRFGEFPDVIADDRFVQVQFAPDERMSCDDLTFTVSAPRTLRAQVRRAIRIQAGNRDLERRRLVRHSDGPGRTARTLLTGVAGRPRLWLDLPVYLAGYSIARFAGAWKLRSGSVTWNTDRTTR